MVQLRLVNIGDHRARVFRVEGLEDLQGHEAEAARPDEEDLVLLGDRAELPDGRVGGDAGAAGNGGEGGVHLAVEPDRLGRLGHHVRGEAAVDVDPIELKAKGIREKRGGEEKGDPRAGETAGVKRYLREEALVRLLGDTGLALAAGALGIQGHLVTHLEV